MKCNDVKNNLVDFATGKIESYEIKQHLEKCESCRAEFLEIKSLVSVLGDYNFEEPSEFYWANFLSRVKNKITKRMNNSAVFALKPVFLAPSLSAIIIGFLFGLIFSSIPVKLDEIYIVQNFDIRTTSLLVRSYEFSEYSEETLEQAVFYLYEKYQLPNFDIWREDYQQIDVDEVLSRISNKF
jgi:predicted anti-sigma-YlaC factor YlaD